MKKTGNYKKSRQKRREDNFIRALIIALILLVAMLVLARITSDKNDGYTVTEDGHVHAADGTHLGSVEEIFGENAENIVVTEDGHIHTADGTHIGDLDDFESIGNASNRS